MADSERKVIHRSGTIGVSVRGYEQDGRTWYEVKHRTYGPPYDERTYGPFESSEAAAARMWRCVDEGWPVEVEEAS